MPGTQNPPVLWSPGLIDNGPQVANLPDERYTLRRTGYSL